MPELAAHLERVVAQEHGPEIEAAIKRGIARWRTKEDEYVDSQGFLTMAIRNEVVKLLAAALAACAREAKLEEAKWRNNHWPPLGAIRTVESLQRWIQDRVEENMQRVACKSDIQEAIGNWGGPEREHYTQAMQRAITAIENRAKGLDLWGRVLERAVGEKASLDPPRGQHES